MMSSLEGGGRGWPKVTIDGTGGGGGVAKGDN